MTHYNTSLGIVKGTLCMVYSCTCTCVYKDPIISLLYFHSMAAIVGGYCNC